MASPTSVAHIVNEATECSRSAPISLASTKGCAETVVGKTPAGNAGPQTLVRLLLQSSMVVVVALLLLFKVWFLPQLFSDPFQPLPFAYFILPWNISSPFNPTFTRSTITIFNLLTYFQLVLPLRLLSQPSLSPVPMVQRLFPVACPSRTAGLLSFLLSLLLLSGLSDLPFQRLLLVLVVDTLTKTAITISSTLTRWSALWCLLPLR